ncbi:MAG: SGNH/GDSL hydrolase family protein [Verrucomicrobiales bacterium]|nr:SGNH/GDSL hydrolase family protein [Verrucomicrobiales bacterium]
MTFAITIKRAVFAMLFIAFCTAAPNAFAYPLTDAQKARLQKLIPRTFAKLQQHAPVHILTLGDSVTETYTPDVDTNHNYLNGYQSKFAQLLALEFFYPGEVRLFNPAKGKPDKANAYLGDEILLENFGLGGRTAIDTLQRITTDAFLNEPDLVMIQYGINDAQIGLSLETYRTAIQYSIDECRKQGVDVILLAPTMVRTSTGPLEWGMTRGHAIVARELALKNGVFFADMGQVIARTSGVGETDAQGKDDIEASQAIRIVADKMGRHFDFVTPPKEFLHPNLSAHQAMGKAIYDQLFNGAPSVAFRAQSRATFQDAGTLEVELTIKNGGSEVREGYMGALTMQKVFEPTQETAFQAYQIEPGKSASFSFTYKRLQQPARGGAPARLKSLDPGEPWLPVSFLLADAHSSSVLDTAPVLEPVAVTWKEGVQLAVTSGIRLDWRFKNAQKKAIQGEYEIKMGQRKASGKFDLAADSQKDFFAEFPINEKEQVNSFKENIHLKVTVAGQSFVFYREAEAVRDMNLGERVALSHDEAYIPGKRMPRVAEAGKEGVSLRVDADKDALYLTFDLEKINLVEVPNGVSLLAEVFIDGRPGGECRQFGFVDRVRVMFAGADGPGQVKLTKMGLFGDAYDRVIPPAGIKSLLKTKGDTSRKVEIRIPRIYLYRHPWNLGKEGEMLGLNAWISLGAVGTGGVGGTVFPPNRRWVLANSRLYLRDARSLITLNLGKKASQSASWSVRIY